MNIKQNILKIISDNINDQTRKGVQTYGQTLDDCNYGDYDWQAMANQELIDCVQYQQKEISRLNEIIKIMAEG